jgi:pimeloyl-ACP methyl ester carboxylesterase
MSGLLAGLGTGIGAGLDRATLPVMERVWLFEGRPSDPGARAEQAHAVAVYADEALAADPLRFFPDPSAAEVTVTRTHPLTGGVRETWRWPSAYRTWDRGYQATYDAWEANRNAWAEAWRHEGGGRATAICLHSWATGYLPVQRWAFDVPGLYRDGFDVLLFAMPFHGPRNPAGSAFGGQLFPGTSPQRTNEGFGQLAWDVRALVRHLRAAGAGPVGVMGMSLGGYAAALLAAIEPELAFSVPMIPMVSWADLLWEHGRGRPERRDAEVRGVTVEAMRKLYAVHSPLLHPPRVAWARRMIVAGEGDRVVGTEPVRRLWVHWDRPRVHWFCGGHLAHFGRDAMHRDVRGFLHECCGTW